MSGANMIQLQKTCKQADVNIKRYADYLFNIFVYYVSYGGSPQHTNIKPLQTDRLCVCVFV